METFGLFLEQVQQHRLYVQHQTNTGLLPTSPPPEDCVSPPPLGPTSLTFSSHSHRNSLMRGAMGPRPARANILSEMTSQDEMVTTYIQRINSQLGILMDNLGKLEGVAGEQTSSGVKKLLKLRKKKSNGGAVVVSQSARSDRASPVEAEGEAVSSSATLSSMASLSNSNPNSLNRSVSLSGLEQPSPRPLSYGVSREEAVNMVQKTK